MPFNQKLAYDSLYTRLLSIRSNWVALDLIGRFALLLFANCSKHISSYFSPRNPNRIDFFLDLTLHHEKRHQIIEKNDFDGCHFMSRNSSNRVCFYLSRLNIHLWLAFYLHQRLMSPKAYFFHFKKMWSNIFIRIVQMNLCVNLIYLRLHTCMHENSMPISFNSFIKRAWMKECCSFHVFDLLKLMGWQFDTCSSHVVLVSTKHSLTSKLCFAYK